ncbi:MAG: ferredoxin [Nanoarchaeota archaeon]|nr:ferredoxin [Nanoarchaeota archaeon]MBU1269680.1 ferredoxin [Nanoarchaeota archaeon]MBU1604102.1 ferredoxin [Nanoarchaeota archaeon]MBU2443606.1 ferredoxin [Nanoarchaeota archaeon]
MGRYKIIYDWDSCIGAAACASIDPEKFKMDDGGKADLLKGTETEPGLWILEVDSLGEALEAAKSCPVNAIKIKDLKENKDLV